jgi:predicted transglutaminase-like cysteine proteinase
MSAIRRAQGASRSRAFFLAVVIAAIIGDESVAKSADKRHLHPTKLPIAMLSVARLVPDEPPGAPARFFTIQGVRADLNGQARPYQPVRLVAVGPVDTMSDVAIRKQARSDDPFGLFAFRAPEGLLWAKWRRLASEIRAEALVLARCRTDADGCPTPAARRFVQILDEASGLGGQARIEAVNHAVNNAIRYMSDAAQHGVPDLWSAPLATLRTGFGDCEDYVIAKYVALHEAGVAFDDMRLIFLKDRTDGQGHAVLAVRDENRWLFLDNRHSTVVEISEVRNLLPLFSISQEGVKILAAPYAAPSALTERH